MNEKWKVRNFSVGYLAKRNFEKQLVAGLDAYPNLVWYSLIMMKMCTIPENDSETTIGGVI